MKLQFLCPDGFMANGPTLITTCVREVAIITVPYIFYMLLGWIRFATLWDAPKYKKVPIQILWNRRVPLIYKGFQIARILAVFTCFIAVNITNVISVYQSINDPDFYKKSMIIYIVNAIKILSWLIATFNIFMETTRGLPIWGYTRVFWIIVPLVNLTKQYYYIVSIINPKIADRFATTAQKVIWYMEFSMFEIEFIASLFLGVIAIFGLFVTRTEMYELRDYTEEKQRESVKLQVRDVIQVFFMAWYLFIPATIGAMIVGYSSLEIADKCGAILTVQSQEELFEKSKPFLWLVPLVAIGTTMQMAFFGTAGETIVMKARNKLFESFSRQDMNFFKSNGTGFLISRLTTDTDIVAIALTFHMSNVVTPLFELIYGLILMFKDATTLGTLLMTFLTFTWMFSAIRSKIVTQYYAAIYSDKRAKATSKAAECIFGYEVIRSYDKDAAEVSNFKKLTRSLRYTGLFKELSEAAFETIEVFMNKTVISLGLFLGCMLVLSNLIERSELNSFTLVGFTAINAFLNLIRVCPELYNASGPLSRILRLMNQKPQYDIDAGDTIPEEELQGGVEFKNISFAYPTSKAPVIEDFNLSIKPGERVAFVGTSGSGKSTILTLVQRFYDVTKGGIFIDGHELSRLKARWWINQLGIVSQRPILFSGTLEDNIKYSCKSQEEYDDEEKFNRAVDYANARSVLEAHEELEKFVVGEGGTGLSGGQQQRISIARCIRKKPKILILDEITSALDPESENELMTSVRELTEGITTLIVAHRLHTIEFVDKIVVMRKGKIMEVGTHASLMATENSIYKRMFETQQSLGNVEQDMIEVETMLGGDTTENELVTEQRKKHQSRLFHDTQNQKRWNQEQLKSEVGRLVHALRSNDHFNNSQIKSMVNSIATHIDEKRDDDDDTRPSNYDQHFKGSNTFDIDDI